MSVNHKVFSSHGGSFYRESILPVFVLFLGSYREKREKGKRKYEKDQGLSFFFSFPKAKLKSDVKMSDNVFSDKTFQTFFARFFIKFLYISSAISLRSYEKSPNHFTSPQMDPLLEGKWLSEV